MSARLSLTPVMDEKKMMPPGPIVKASPRKFFGDASLTLG
jgi:hypothetical protein